MTIENVKEIIRNIPDFPREGILFKDLTTAFQDTDCLKFLLDELVRTYNNKGITKVIGIESRGFILGGALATEIGAGFVPIRKKGKLPNDTIEESYDMEYGTNTIEIHQDAINETDIVLLHDDLLATGGTMKAALNLVQRFGIKKVYINFLVELDFLEARKLFPDEIEVISLIHYGINE
jgi:adenine phosphoribosyltransferase